MSKTYPMKLPGSHRPVKGEVWGQAHQVQEESTGRFGTASRSRLRGRTRCRLHGGDTPQGFKGTADQVLLAVELDALFDGEEADLAIRQCPIKGKTWSFLMLYFYSNLVGTPIRAIARETEVPYATTRRLLLEREKPPGN